MKDIKCLYPHEIMRILKDLPNKDVISYVEVLERLYRDGNNLIHKQTKKIKRYVELLEKAKRCINHARMFLINTVEEYTDDGEYKKCCKDIDEVLKELNK